MRTWIRILLLNFRIRLFSFRIRILELEINQILNTKLTKQDGCPARLLPSRQEHLAHGLAHLQDEPGAGAHDAQPLEGVPGGGWQP